jgi:hypothetical protein
MKLVLSEKIPKTDIIWKFSNPIVSQKNSYKYLGKRNGVLYRSTVYDKKHNRHVSFGHIDYEDFTKHKDKMRRKNYLRRSSKIKGNWKKDKYSPNNLSRNILW